MIGYIHIYIYIHTHTHTHTHIYIYIYRTHPALIGNVWVVPLMSFYDRSLDFSCMSSEYLRDHGGMGHNLVAVSEADLNRMVRVNVYKRRVYVYIHMYYKMS
jgi:hypothetical protein